MKIRPNALAIIEKDGYILASKGVDNVTKEIFYRLLGGGIEFGELSSEAVKREFVEELNAVILNEKFLCIAENIFEYNGEKGHEITFIYKADFQDESLYSQKSIKRIDHDSEFADWVSVDEIKKGNIIIYPRETINYL
jgi:ADP-ribose pyrophosphatase YjhB (NUDIX family)